MSSAQWHRVYLHLRMSIFTKKMRPIFYDRYLHCLVADRMLQRIKAVADQMLRGLSPIFAEMYSAVCHPSIPSERFLNRDVLITEYSMRSRWLFSERLDTDFLFRRFWI